MSNDKEQRKSGKQKALARTGAAVMVSLSSLSLAGAMAATATLPIIARLIRAIEITVNASLDFGTLALTEEAPGLVTLDPQTESLRMASQGGVMMAGGVPKAGQVRLKGAAIPVSVSVETNNVLLSNGSTHLTLQNFNFISADGGTQVTVTPTGPHSAVTLPIGASLKTRAGQLSGTYIGSNKIFANYQ